MAVDISTEDFLEHYGVLGMHWGRHLPGRDDRSAPGKKASKKSSLKPGTHPDHAKAHALDKKPIHQLSNAEIQRLNNRAQLEKKLVESRANNSSLKRGHDHVKQILAISATAGVAGGLVTKGFTALRSPEGQAAIKLGGLFISKKIGFKLPVRRVFSVAKALV